MLNLKDYVKTEHEYIYKHKTNGTFLVRYSFKNEYYNKRKIHMKSGLKSISECKDIIAELRTNIKNNGYKQLEKNFKLSEVYKIYIDELKIEVKKGNLASSSLDSKETIFKIHILPKLGNIYIKDIDEDHIRKFQEDLLTTRNKRIKGQILSNGTMRKIHKQLSAFLNWCVRKRLIFVNPAAIVGNFKKQKKEQPYLKLQEFKQLLSVVDNERDFFIIALLFSTGLRIGEMLGLTLDSIKQTENGMKLSIYQTYYKGKIRNRAKTDEAMNDLYLDDVTIKWYNQYLNYREKNNITSNYLFPNLKNIGNCEVLSDRAVRDMLKKYLKRANINKDITPHKLRHSQAALLIYLGKDLEEVKTRLRHKDIRTTSNEYGHMYTEKKVELANDIGKELNKMIINNDFYVTSCVTCEEK